jgi:hypothetical protein
VIIDSFCAIGRVAGVTSDADSEVGMYTLEINVLAHAAIDIMNVVGFAAWFTNTNPLCFN